MDANDNNEQIAAKPIYHSDGKATGKLYPIDDILAALEEDGQANLHGPSFKIQDESAMGSSAIIDPADDIIGERKQENHNFLTVNGQESSATGSGVAESRNPKSFVAMASRSSSLRSAHRRLSNKHSRISYRKESITNMGSSLLSFSFSRAFDSLVCGTSQGFRVYNCDNFQDFMSRDFGAGGIRMVEKLSGWNVLALVGGRDNTEFPPNKVTIWDDDESRCIRHIPFKSEVLALKFGGDLMAVALENMVFVYLYRFGSHEVKLLHKIQTVRNPKGLCAVSEASGSCVLACLGLVSGRVHVEHYALNKKKLISAHTSKIACLCLCNEGRLLATASLKGTVIRIFDSFNGACLQQVRRGLRRAEIYSIAFSHNLKWIALSSSKGTVHVFDVDEHVIRNLSSKTNLNQSKQVAPPCYMKGLFRKCFTSEWSLAQYRFLAKTRCLVGFQGQNTLVMVTFDGRFYKCEFDPVQGGKMMLNHCEMLSVGGV